MDEDIIYGLSIMAQKTHIWERDASSLKVIKSQYPIFESCPSKESHLRRSFTPPKIAPRELYLHMRKKIIITRSHSEASIGFKGPTTFILIIQRMIYAVNIVEESNHIQNFLIIDPTTDMGAISQHISGTHTLLIDPKYYSCHSLIPLQ